MFTHEVYPVSITNSNLSLLLILAIKIGAKLEEFVVSALNSYVSPRLKREAIIIQNVLISRGHFYKTATAVEI